jgi:hypothetical protein
MCLIYLNCLTVIKIKERLLYHSSTSSIFCSYCYMYFYRTKDTMFTYVHVCVVFSLVSILFYKGITEEKNLKMYFCTYFPLLVLFIPPLDSSHCHSHFLSALRISFSTSSMKVCSQQILSFYLELS